jgi:hypothetical protein
VDDFRGGCNSGTRGKDRNAGLGRYLSRRARTASGEHCSQCKSTQQKQTWIKCCKEALLHTHADFASLIVRASTPITA